MSNEYKMPLINQGKTVFVYGLDRSYKAPKRPTIIEQNQINRQCWDLQRYLRVLFDHGYDTFLFYQMGNFEMLVHMLIHSNKPKDSEIKLWQILPHKDFPEYDIPSKGLGNATTTRYFFNTEEAYKDQRPDITINYLIHNCGVLLIDTIPVRLPDNHILKEARYAKKIILAAEKL